MRKDLIIPMLLLGLTTLMVITVIVISFFLRSPNKPVPKEATLATPTPISERKNVEPVIPISSRQQLINMLPVRNDSFTIEYLAKTDTIIVTIIKNPYTQNRQKALNWFKERGVNDIKTMNVLLVHLQYVK